jgi:hypothetical protein
VTLNEIGRINIHEGAGPRHPPKHRAVAYVIFAYVYLCYFRLCVTVLRRTALGRRSQEVVEARLDDFVALARRFFKAGTIENFYSAVPAFIFG